MARPPLEGAEVGADGQLRCASARCRRPGARLGAALSASMITMDACGSVAGGREPAAEGWIMRCRVTEQSPGSVSFCPAVRAAASRV
jgi:hypothetical protein